MASTHNDLSLDISRLLAGVRKGSPIDAKAEGAELALRYADLGVSAEMLEQAILRAAGMAKIRLGPASDEHTAPETEEPITVSWPQFANGSPPRQEVGEPVQPASTAAAAGDVEFDFSDVLREVVRQNPGDPAALPAEVRSSDRPAGTDSARRLEQEGQVSKLRRSATALRRAIFRS